MACPAWPWRPETEARLGCVRRPPRIISGADLAHEVIGAGRLVSSDVHPVRRLHLGEGRSRTMPAQQTRSVGAPRTAAASAQTAADLLRVTDVERMEVAAPALAFGEPRQVLHGAAGSAGRSGRRRTRCGSAPRRWRCRCRRWPPRPGPAARNTRMGQRAGRESAERRVRPAEILPRATTSESRLAVTAKRPRSPPAG